MPKTAIILGASGATGSELLQLLLADARYSTIKLFNRSLIGIANPKIQEHIINLLELDKYADQFTADEVFCCIGTTKAKTPDKDAYYKIDFGIPATAAKLAKANGITTFIVVSAVGANSKSGIFYNRTKGQMEEAVLAQNIARTHILEPSLIVAQRKDNRILEKLFINLWKLVDPLLYGSAGKYKSVTAHNIAKAMLWLANNTFSDVIVKSDTISRIAC
ncbi:NAD(P)H-binding protein [Flavobacterium subsaxonicum]|uniref:Nucleoside-diphosphate sugar epimerase n=1 Tax=Flavobacterium subsaxonicum WB 4.1-42 = DSM 21790 TaxID=1121898 RepID=A0A0A2MHL4_9FLAO|nr:NAD(P)H-binding protein [Flavobacterium subsaxonicum]KGO91769.1 nucleoside-diphosphate sugar epimerase [Flavobacterium subsaxonicum WB 4.1-42 = DSM 21790]